MTQKELALRLGYSPKHINQVLRKRLRPSVHLAKKLEQFLHIPWTTWFEENQSDSRRMRS